MASEKCELETLESRLRELQGESSSVQARIDKLRVAQISIEPRIRLGTPAVSSPPESVAGKIDLFLRLFRCRESVYAKLWENPKKGIKGYAPACLNEWKPGICNKPKIKCSECPHQAFPKLDAVAADAHLRGKQTIGTYAIREDDTCTFLACDFDGTGWNKEIRVYQSVADDMGVQVAIERSRSGQGGHAWIFFSEPVQARVARMLGTRVLGRCHERLHTLRLESYDRFFPNQDYLPKGGFGNLIALPLQKAPREVGNSSFVDETFTPYPNQWDYLASVRRVTPYELRELLQDVLSLPPPSVDTDASLIIDAKLTEETNDEKGRTLRGMTVEIGLGPQLAIPLQGLTSKIVTCLKRAASFPNPMFYRLQRMRMQTWPNPRFIFSGELRRRRSSAAARITGSSSRDSSKGRSNCRVSRRTPSQQKTRPRIYRCAQRRAAEGRCCGPERRIWRTCGASRSRQDRHGLRPHGQAQRSHAGTGPSPAIA